MLEDRHGNIDVQVARVMQNHGGEDGKYSRSIFLRAPGGGVVARAVLHADLDRLPEVVKRGVVEEGIPFGKLLMDHVKERCVRLEALWRVALAGQGYGSDHGGGACGDLVVSAPRSSQRSLTPKTNAKDRSSSQSED